MWVGLIQSVEGIKRGNRFPREEGRNSALRQWHRHPVWVFTLTSCPKFQTQDCHIYSCLNVRPEDFKPASLHNHVSQFLKISLFISVYPMDSISLENPDYYTGLHRCRLNETFGSQIYHSHIKGGKQTKLWETLTYSPILKS